MKRCGQCGYEKTTDEFFRDKNKKDGMMTQCKECHYAKVLRYRRDRPRKIKDWNRKYQDGLRAMRSASGT